MSDDANSCASPKEFCASFSGAVSSGTNLIGVWDNVQGHDTIYALLAGSSPHTVTVSLHISQDATAGDTIKFGAIESNGNPRSGGMTVTVASSGTETNNAATGQPGISGAPQRGETLTATMGDIQDADGLDNQTFPGDYTFQWAKDGSDIAGATSSTYDVPAAETLGATFTVAVSFSDDEGNAEGPLTSDATPGTIDAPEDCATDRADSDWCTTMTVGVSGGSGNPVTTYGYRGGTGNTFGSLDDAAIGYGGETWTVAKLTFEDSPVVNGDTYNINLDGFVPQGSVFDLGGATQTADATSEQSTTGQYKWFDDANPGWLQDQKVTVSANLAPIVTDAAVHGATLTLTFAEDLDTNSKPAASAFTVYIDGDTTGVNPSSVDTISGKTVAMTLATAVTIGQTVTLDYAKPATNPLRDESELDAPSFTGLTVTNESTNNPADGKPGITGRAPARRDPHRDPGHDRGRRRPDHPDLPRRLHLPVGEGRNRHRGRDLRHLRRAGDGNPRQHLYRQGLLRRRRRQRRGAADQRRHPGHRRRQGGLHRRPRRQRLVHNHDRGEQDHLVDYILRIQQHHKRYFRKP